MRVLLLLALLALGAVPVSGEERAKPFFVNPADWLAIDRVDIRGRRPFNPDAVFARYLLDRRSGVPHEGDEITGERGKPQTWKKVKADKDGRVGGGGMAWAYTRVQSDRDRVVVARLLNAARLFVNGTAHVGAVYGHGFQTPPVVLKKGGNDVFVRGIRGRFKLTFEPAPAPVFVAPHPLHVPDLVAGEPVDTVAGVWIVNARTEPLDGLRIDVLKNDHVAAAVVNLAETVPPLGMRQVALPVRGTPGKTLSEGVPHVDVVFRLEGAPISRLVRLPVRTPDQSILRTFVSKIDESVQVYGVRRPSLSKEGQRPMGLVLSLHGAGVNPRGQADAYSAKPDFWLVVPTNRAPFGFDWQDWGRLDAYEVLEDALRHTGVERARVYLTGHSMGGHGTWHLAANDPDGFAAIAPSAGWISFDTYGGRPKGELSAIWHAADRASRTRTLIGNLKQLPTYIVHGTKDDNVPIAQAHAMEKRLTAAGAKPQVRYAEGKGHWWNGDAAKGVDCVDWPGIFEMFRKHAISKAPLDLEFETVDPGVDSRHHWVTIYRPLIYGEPSSVAIRTNAQKKTFEIRTRNVRALSLRHPLGLSLATVDGFGVELDPTQETVLVQGSGPPWSVHPGLQGKGGKTPGSSGPFKRAFHRGFVFVYGSKGTPAENRELLERARHDASAWAYRANGQSRVLRDTDYLARREALRGRNVILYGNTDTNAAFSIIRRNRSAPRAGRGQMWFRSRSWIGEDLAAVYVYPQNDDTGALVAVFADTGVPGTRLGYTLLPFVSGVGYPDYVVFNARTLEKGDGGVLAAGWFDRDWKLQQEGSFIVGK